MAYYFECKECNHKETFADTFEIPLDNKVTDYKTQKEIAKKALDESLRKK